MSSNDNTTLTKNPVDRFTKRDLEILVYAFMSPKGGSLQVDFEKLATFSGTTSTSVAIEWADLLCKILCEVLKPVRKSPKQTSRISKVAAATESKKIEGDSSFNNEECPDNLDLDLPLAKSELVGNDKQNLEEDA
ncbi:hypothetical protein PSV09DRAFT_2263450 [Bipolaris maydis]|nr:hypothetical protein J3E74DRAFT_295904 [Bipolaris maydis]KAJ5052669.1 hypothetical protein J3E74DRAFT_295746 [Bipolaris maydis]KAJ6203822.1 hypothetical protein PSV09DRAFT_2263450 [Bipolaris maydis]